PTSTPAASSAPATEPARVLTVVTSPSTSIGTVVFASPDATAPEPTSATAVAAATIDQRRRRVVRCERAERAARRLGVGAWVAGAGSGEVSASPFWGAPKREKSCTEDPVVGGPGHGGRRRARTSGAPRTAHCGSGAPVRPADPAVLRPPAPPGRSSRAAPRGRPYTCPR